MRRTEKRRAVQSCRHFTHVKISSELKEKSKKWHALMRQMSVYSRERNTLSRMNAHERNQVHGISAVFFIFEQAAGPSTAALRAMESSFPADNKKH